MSFQEDRDILIQYLSKHDFENEQEWEEFFQFIDELEEKASEEAQYFSLLADAYMSVGYNLKAKEAFLKIANPKNKKDRKKLISFESMKASPVVRPKNRAKNLPSFRYVAKETLKNKFFVSEECTCAICKKNAAALYVGKAYNSFSEKITYINQEEKFCADCLCNGSAAAEFHIRFNPLVEMCTAIASEKAEEVVYRTPECNSEFDFNEDIWPSCCGDFCRYTGLENEYEERFHFQCLHCGKEIVWTKMT